jgi:protein-S-isoprenylcysteine O-methyltransferase Ste14
MLRSGSRDRKDLDKGSILIIWITIGIAITAGVLAEVYVKCPIGHSATIPVVGLGLIILGMIIRFAAIISLGRFFTVDVTIREGHRLKTDGLYRFVRHPSYAGSILSFIGFGLSLNNWISLPVISLPVTLAIIYRIHIEEKLLLQEFGEEFREYRKKTWRLVPLIF